MKKQKGRNTPWLLIVLAVCLSLAAGYYVGRTRPEKPLQPPKADQTAALKEPGSKEEQEIPMMREKIHVGVDGASKPAAEGDECRRVQKDLKDFFEYLDHKPYVQQIEPGIETRKWFDRILTKLSASPPAPAGEGLDPVAMTNNVFYFFRNLEFKEMKLLREVMVNEASTLEANMDLFFKWLSLGNRCPEKDGLKPPPEVLYSYAGFFLNTIGGRAYLFRNSPAVRRLVTYYCILIVHDADRKGKNLYGIDLAPHLKALSTEISHQDQFLLQEGYLDRLEEIGGFYRGRATPAKNPPAPTG